MKVDRNTEISSFAAFVPVLADGERERLCDAAARDLYGEGGFWLMPLGDLFTIYDGDTRPLAPEGGRTVFDVFRVIGFEKWIEDYAAALEGLTLPPTADEVLWRSGTTKPTFENAVRVFCRDWFALPNYKAVDSLTVTDLLIAKEAAYNRAVVDRNMAAALKSKKGGRR